ncbi:MAG TPA: nucleotidyltransferase family protein [Phycisphaerae bacterium]|nr:nucleotidyltransferase family protein [Phycisphaerae bacterium]HRW55465.1 nucleotidyltransferase family protein [Phycisphaerae bacterium]
MQASNILKLIAGVLSERPDAALREIRDARLWGRVALCAWRQRVGGLLLARLCELDVRVPDAAMRELAGYARHVREANAVKVDRVLPVIEALAGAGVRCVLLKGAALLASIYDDWSMRPMVDVDLLIAPEQTSIAEEVLLALGWLPGADLLRPDFFPRYHYEREYVTQAEPKVRLDLHVRPFRPLRFASTIPPGAFLGASVDTELAGGVVAVLDPDMNLIHLAAHAALHGANELRWLYDIYAWATLRSGDLDVDAIADRCRSYRLEHAVRTALCRVRETLGPTPRLDEILERLPRRSAMMDRLVLWQAPHGEARHVTDVCVNAISLPSWGDRAAYLSAVALPDSSHLRQIYPHRHWAWPIAAHATRLGRLLTRPLARRDAS